MIALVAAAGEVGGMSWTLSFDRLRSILVATVTHLPDHHRGPRGSTRSRMRRWGRLPCSSPNRPRFWPIDRDMQRRKGHNNAQSLFGVDQVPTDPQIRNLLDPIAPEHLAAPFWQVFEHLHKGDYLQAYQGWLGPWLMAFDGTQYFHSTADPLSAVHRAHDQRAHALLACVGGTPHRGPGPEPGDCPGAGLHHAAGWPREAGL